MFAGSPFNLSSPPTTLSNIGPGTLQTPSVLNFPATQTGTAVNRQIYGSANGLNFNVPTGGTFQVMVNGVNQLTFGLGGITNFGGTGSGVSGNIQIISLGGSLAYNVPTGGYHSFYVQGAAQLQIGLGGIAALGNGLGTVMAANIQLVSAAANTLTANVPTGGSFVVDVNAVPIFTLGGTLLTFTVPLRFTGAVAVAAGYNQIGQNTYNYYNVPTGTYHAFMVNGVEVGRFQLGGLTSRITKRAPAITQAAQPAINTDITDVAHITGLAQAITSMTANLTGTPVEGDTLRIDFTDNGVGRAIAWGTKFEASTAPLPTTTVAGARLDVGFVWDSANSAWRCVATA